MNKTEFTCPCPQCGKTKCLSEKPRKRNRETPCKTCAGKNRTKSTDKERFTRVCDTCGKLKKTPREVLATTCVKCSRKKTGKTLVLNRTYSEAKTAYHYFCRTCPSVRVLRARRKTSYCSVCVRKHTKGESLKIYFDFTEMKMKIPKVRHFAICPECPPETATRLVQNKKVAGIVRCVKHRIQPKDIKRKTRTVVKTKTKTKSKAKEVSPEAIARAKEINREHRAEVKESKKEETVQIPQTKSDEEMIAEFLAKKKPSVRLADNSREPLISCAMRVSNDVNIMSA